ncbi:MAG: hypothetical protein HFJ80_00330 [Clostridiales bacterium]|nr:hypothetical protein [Clostridiales bacterium]
MSLVLDILALVLVAGVALSRLNRSVLSSALTLLSVLLALAGSFFLSQPSGELLADHLVTPAAEKMAANELADMVSAPHKSSGRETAAELPLEDMTWEWSVSFERLCGQYGVSRAEVEAAAPEGPLAVLAAITAGFSGAFSRSVSMAVLFIVLLVLVRLLLHRIVEQNLPPPAHPTAFKRLASAFLGALTGLTVLLAFLTALALFLPRSPAESLLFSPSLIERTDLCRFVQVINPFCLLL